MRPSADTAGDVASRLVPGGTIVKQLILAVAVSTSAAGSAATSDNATIVGDYVETRTAEVFTGGCLMNSEGETGGREALMAWRVRHGALDGVTLDGLAVVAAVAGDVNLGTREIGGAAPSRVEAVLYVDVRATAPQQAALVSLAHALSNGLATHVVAIKPVAISFEREIDAIRVSAGDAILDVGTEMEHDASCGAMQWFQPLARIEDAALGVTRRQAYSGTLLDSRWQQVDRRSAFFGGFSY
jgi:hypothetical protein